MGTEPIALAWEGGEAGERPRVVGSDKVLSDRLAQLTSAGVIERHRTPGWPPRVRYVLTSQGRALEPVMRSMWEWGMVRRNALG